MTRWEIFLLIGGALRPVFGEPAIELPAEALPWEQIASAASHHLVSPALGWALAREPRVPAEAAEYFDTLLALSRRRHDAMAEGLADVVTTLNASGVTPALLKGAAMLVDASYPDRGLRVLADLDLLVREHEIAAAGAALAANGYRAHEPARMPPRHHHLPLMIHTRTGLGVELHRQPLEARLGLLLDAVRSFEGGTRVEVGQGHAVLLSPLDRLVHAVAHGQISDRNHRRGVPELRQLLDVAILRRRCGADGARDAMAARFAAAGAGRIVDDTLACAGMLFGSLEERAAWEAHPAVRRMRRALERGVVGRAYASLVVAAADTASALADDPRRVIAAASRLAAGRSRRRNPW